MSEVNTYSYDTQTITFTQANNATPPSYTAGGYANTMTINLPTPMELSNADVALASLYCYYSWFNISANFQNNTLSYTLPPTAGNTWAGAAAPYTVFTNSSTPAVIGDGLYSIADLNNALAFTFQYNGHYYIDANGSNVYPITISVNTTGYTINITLSQLYSSGNIPTGWTVPATSIGGPKFTTTTFTNNCVASLNIPATGNPAGTYVNGQTSMSKVLGFTPASYPVQTGNPNLITAGQFQYQSQYPPQVGVINSVNVACNLVNASTISPLGASVIYNFAPNVQSGQLIQEQPTNLVWLPVTQGKYNSISFTLLTDAFRPLPIVDPAVSVTLLIRRRTLPTRKQTFTQQALAGDSFNTSSLKRARPEDPRNYVEF
jgi:hypothetical protein